MSRATSLSSPSAGTRCRSRLSGSASQDRTTSGLPNLTRYRSKSAGWTAFDAARSPLHSTGSGIALTSEDRSRCILGDRTPPCGRSWPHPVGGVRARTGMSSRRAGRSGAHNLWSSEALGGWSSASEPWPAACVVAHLDPAEAVLDVPRVEGILRILGTVRLRRSAALFLPAGHVRS